MVLCSCLQCHLCLLYWNIPMFAQLFRSSVGMTIAWYKCFGWQQLVPGQRPFMDDCRHNPWLHNPRIESLNLKYSNWLKVSIGVFQRFLNITLLTAIYNFRCPNIPTLYLLPVPFWNPWELNRWRIPWVWRCQDNVFILFQVLHCWCPGFQEYIGPFWIQTCNELLIFSHRLNRHGSVVRVIIYQHYKVSQLIRINQWYFHQGHPNSLIKN